MKSLRFALRRIHHIEQLEAELRDNPTDKNLVDKIFQLRYLHDALSQLERKFYDLLGDDK